MEIKNVFIVVPSKIGFRVQTPYSLRYVSGKKLNALYFEKAEFADGQSLWVKKYAAVELGATLFLSKEVAEETAFKMSQHLVNKKIKKAVERFPLRGVEAP